MLGGLWHYCTRVNFLESHSATCDNAKLLARSSRYSLTSFRKVREGLVTLQSEVASEIVGGMRIPVVPKSTHGVCRGIIWR
jgi:hypothetical protein